MDCAYQRQQAKSPEVLYFNLPLKYTQHELTILIWPPWSHLPLPEGHVICKSDNQHRLVKARELVIFAYWNLHINAVLK